MAYQSIQELIEHFSEFESETGSQDLGSFAAWLHHRLNGPKEPLPEANLQLDQGILQAFGELSYHARHYIKKAIKDTPLSSWNDLVILIVLFYEGAQRKSVLIQKALMDLSSGIEVVNRLLRKGLLRAARDPADKRAKVIGLSEDGKALFLSLDGQLSTAGRIVAGNLSNEEKAMLLPLLQKLVHFHTPIFQEGYTLDLPAIAEKYLGFHE